MTSSDLQLISDSAEALHARRGDTERSARRAGVATEGLEERLLDAVVGAKGSGFKPRPGQVMLLRDITEAVSVNTDHEHPSANGSTGGKLLGQAPTGVGKSYASLVPAMVQALDGHRTVVSTESLGLQAQLRDKDLPAIADACEKLTGVRPTYAVHKGWSNYACMRMSHDAVSELLGNAAVPKVQNLDDGEDGDIPSDTPSSKAPPKLRALDAQGKLRQAYDRLVGARERNSPATAAEPDRVALIEWALQQGLEPNSLHGDRNTWEGSARNWDEVSISSTDCPGSKCPFYEVCLPRRARAEAATADIVVTNHTLLGIQATKQVPVIISSAKMGPFQNLVIDEAHALPGVVRAQGATEVSGPVMRRLLRAFITAIDPTGVNLAVQRVKTTASNTLDAFEAELERFRPRSGTESRISDEVDPLEGTGERVFELLEDMRTYAKGVARKADPGTPEELRLTRLIGRIESMVDDLDSVREHKFDSARWAQVEDGGRGDPYLSLRFSPVDVSGLLNRNLYLAETVMDPDEMDEHDMLAERQRREAIKAMRAADGGEELSDEDDFTYGLNIIAISATMPKNFAAEAGLYTRIRKYESPFATTYADSALYIPTLSPDELDLLTRSSGYGLDTAKHPEWAAEQIAALVEANGGSALVLSATAKAGRQYVDHLREALPGLAIHSQWGGLPLRQAIDAWKSDTSSVLVGTRSLMTGVDAPGQTCSLVVIDRVPRAPGNPVDDARVESLVEREIASNKWDGDRYVYVSDAANLLAQATGRLVRGVNDVGMVAVLDPRLLKSSPMAYKSATREDLMTPLRAFGHKFKHLDDATSYLTGRRADAS